MIKTVLLDTLPGNANVDGYIGWGFLRRFKSAFDFNKSRMIIELKGANLIDNKPHNDRFTIRSVPISDWTGMRIIDVDIWATSGLKKGDILKSIDDIPFSTDKMYSLLRNAQPLLSARAVIDISPSYPMKTHLSRSGLWR